MHNEDVDSLFTNIALDDKNITHVSTLTLFIMKTKL